MKALLSFLLMLFNVLPIQSQPATDSLEEILKNTGVYRANLQKYLDQVQTMGPDEIEKIRVIGEWVINNTYTDSLQEMQATANLVLGKIYTVISSYGEATRYLTSALSISEKNNFYRIQAEALNALGSVYNSNEQYEKALDFYKKSLAISKQHNFLHGIARAGFNLGNTQLNSQHRDAGLVRSSINLMLRGLGIVQQLKDTQSIITQSWGLSNAYAILKNYDSAEAMLGIAGKLITASGKEFTFIRHYNKVAKLYSDKKEYSEAIKYYEKGLALAKKYTVPRWMCQYYTGMAETYENMGNYKKANLYNQLNIKMHDALVSKENFAAAADIQNRYERAKKDNEILKLAAVSKQKSTINIILALASFGLLLISFLSYTNFKNRSKILKQQEEIQVQKITRLEKDKQLVSIDAMLKGQEEERSRIAKDLHDGLGGLLSGTKLSFMHVKETLDLPPEKATQFDRSLSMLDNTIGDLRKVAQNLMPEALVKFGLHEALRDFCDSIQSSSGIKLLYHHYGEKRKLDNTAEVFIYRIIQELVNNAVKHADASQVIVQLTMNKNKTAITIEDNGNGFDKNMLNYTKGAGMANIEYRVQYFNGTTDIVSSPGNGTSVNIELNT
ncbi:MAG: tetratricopeptide repeat protein [Ferruginibacter sp.]|nr:tetratricopeptide repeat protein [Ferruginibacter sp.]